ncbi:EthD family reductase [Paraburkholderia sp.]|uniref:EthD family reductase n=1 Tax=Paraburkholderia sp. TaxID=1926495 RepID=UPI003D6FA1DB
MEVCLFLIGAHGRTSSLDIPALRHAANAIDGLRRLIVHESIEAHVDPRIAANPDSPPCVLQWYFDDLTALEAALRPAGAVQDALYAASLATVDAHAFSQQVMAVRALAPPQIVSAGDAAQRCTCLVAYEGPAEDFSAWLTHYLDHHPPLMLQLPALRELEIYTRVDSRSGLPFAQANAMQRNKVVFDDPAALARALASPVRDAMRRDFHALPAYGGATPHYAMRSFYGNLASH